MRSSQKATITFVAILLLFLLSFVSAELNKRDPQAPGDAPPAAPPAGGKAPAGDAPPAGGKAPAGGNPPGGAPAPPAGGNPPGGAPAPPAGGNPPGGAPAPPAGGNPPGGNPPGGNPPGGAPAPPAGGNPPGGAPAPPAGGNPPGGAPAPPAGGNPPGGAPAPPAGGNPPGGAPAPPAGGNPPGGNPPGGNPPGGNPAGGNPATNPPKYVDPATPTVQVVMIDPKSSKNVLYKIGANITFKWGYSDVFQDPPQYITVAAQPQINIKTNYTIAQNLTLNATQEVVWVTSNVPSLPMSEYKLIICDQDGFNAPPKPGGLQAFSNLQFGLYTPQDTSAVCATCVNAASIPIISSLSSTIGLSLITIISFSFISI